MGSVGSVQFQIAPCSSLYLFSRSICPLQHLDNVNYRVLISCTCHFQSSSVFFVYFGFLYLQVSSLSNFHPDTRGQKVVTNLACSAVLCGGKDTANKYCWRVLGSACTVWTTLGLPQLKVACASWVYTAQAPGCSAGALSRVGPVFCALPRSKLLRFSGNLQAHRLSWACILCPSQVQAAQVTRCL